MRGAVGVIESPRGVGMSRTKVRKLFLHGYRQFRDVALDFTHPETGEALDRVCLIGRNGTGKTTVLELIQGYFHSVESRVNLHQSLGEQGWLGVELEVAGRRLLWCGPVLVHLTDAEGVHLDVDAAAIVRAGAGREAEARRQGLVTGNPDPGAFERFGLLQPGSDLLISWPAEVAQNQILAAGGVPTVTLSQALHLFNHDRACNHEISSATVSEMWRQLLYLLKKRESDRDTFENLPENQDKTKRQLVAEFNTLYPSPLDGLAALWDRILAPVGLELDVAGVKQPVQLHEHLEAFLRLKSSGEPLPYPQLSTGIRNFLFRVGHLYLLYSQRPVSRGLLLVDEPENSLFPDFLFELMEIFEQILGGAQGQTQAFFATHSPLVAAQFEPWERVVLEWDGEGGVVATRGSAPKGDDPNDLLLKDFHLPEVMGPAGRAAWQHYQDLRRQIRRSEGGERDRLVNEAQELAREYDFAPERS